MAKKRTASRRVPRSTTPRTFSTPQPSAPAKGGPTTGAPEAVAPRSTGAVASVRPSTYTEIRRRAAAKAAETRPQLPLAQEYRYVPADLRRLGILAGGTAAVLVVLGLIIH